MPTEIVRKKLDIITPFAIIGGTLLLLWGFKALDKRTEEPSIELPGHLVRDKAYAKYGDIVNISATLKSTSKEDYDYTVSAEVQEGAWLGSPGTTVQTIDPQTIHIRSGETATFSFSARPQVGWGYDRKDVSIRVQSAMAYDQSEHYDDVFTVVEQTWALDAVAIVDRPTNEGGPYILGGLLQIDPPGTQVIPNDALVTIVAPDIAVQQIWFSYWEVDGVRDDEIPRTFQFRMYQSHTIRAHYYEGPPTMTGKALFHPAYFPGGSVIDWMYYYYPAEGGYQTDNARYDQGQSVLLDVGGKTGAISIQWRDSAGAWHTKDFPQMTFVDAGIYWLNMVTGEYEYKGT